MFTVSLLVACLLVAALIWAGHFFYPHDLIDPVFRYVAGVLIIDIGIVTWLGLYWTFSPSEAHWDILLGIFVVQCVAGINTIMTRKWTGFLNKDTLKHFVGSISPGYNGLIPPFVEEQYHLEQPVKETENANGKRKGLSRLRDAIARKFARWFGRDKG